MTSRLETRISELISAFRRLKDEKAELEARLVEREEVLSSAIDENEQLRARIDSMDKDRFTIKRLRDERKAVRKQVGAAMERLDKIEKEL